MSGDADSRQREHAVRCDSAESTAGYLRGEIGERVAPADAAEARVGERDDWVEVPTGDRTEYEDDRVEPCRCGGRVLEQLEANVIRGERLRRDARADHESSKESR